MKFESPCSSCVHNNVCRHKQGMQEAVLRIREEVEGTAAIEVRITCKDYMEKVTVRAI